MSHKRILYSIFFLFLVFPASLTNAQQNQDAPAQLSQKQIKELVAPVALYPDPLLAEVLAAATYPLDVVTAARYLQANPKSAQIDQQNWDSSVKAVAHYPEVLNKMNDNLQWTQNLGLAFLNQQKELFASVQSLRKQAEKKGNLKNSPEQKVVDEKGVIQILPAQEETIAVPNYDPTVVYSSPVVVGGPSYAFSSGFYLGSWFTLGCNWWGGGAYIWGPYYWGNWGYPAYFGYGGYGYYPYYHYPYYNHYYPYYNHYYPYSYNHGNPWAYNPYHGGPRPYIAHPGQPAPWGTSNQGTNGFTGTRGNTGFTGSNPGMRGTMGHQPFNAGVNQSPSSNMFGSMGNGHNTNFDSQRGNQNSGASGSGNFGSNRGSSQQFNSNGGVYLPKGASGFNQGWNHSFNGAGNNAFRGGGGFSSSSGMSHGFVGSSFRGSSGGGSFSGFGGGGFHGMSGMSGGGGGFHGFSGGGGGGFHGFSGGGGRR